MMFEASKAKVYRLLRWSERYTKTDMVYLAESGFWLQAGSFFISFGSFLLYIVFGHFLSKDVYGTYQYLLSLGAIVTAFTLTGMSSAVTRAVARGFEGTYLQSIRVQLLWGILPMLGSWALGGYYLAHDNRTLGWGLVLIGIFVPLSTVYNTYGAYLTAKKDFKRGFLYNAGINLLYYISVAFIAISVPLALALLAANVISQAMGYVLAHRRMLSVYRPNAEREPGAMRYGGHLSLINLLTAIVAQIDNVLVFHFLGAADLALYSFATAIPSRLGIFKSLSSIAFPKFAERSPGDIRTSIARKVWFSIIGAFGIAVVYALIARPFFLLFFPNYLDAVPFSQAYAFIIVAGFSPLFTIMLTAHGRVKTLYIYNIVAPIILILSELVGVTQWGLWGLVYAVIFANLFNSLLSAALALLIPTKITNTISQ